MIRQVVDSQETAAGVEIVVRQARLLGLINVAMADAGILAWREK